MGRAITMENELDGLKSRLKIAEDALSKVIETVDAMQEKSSQVKPVKKEKKNDKAKTKKADNQRPDVSDNENESGHSGDAQKD